MKPNKDKMRSEGFLQLGRICFPIHFQQSENFSEFCEVSSQFAFRNMIVPLPKVQTRHPARAHAPLNLPHGFFDKKGFTKSFPSSHLLSRNLAKMLQVLIYDKFCFLAEIGLLRTRKKSNEPGRGL